MEQFLIEFKRGTLTMAVLSQLKKPQYGYSLLETLQAFNYPVESGTLYPLLRRLEKQGLCISEWDTQESRPRKYYSLSPLGHETLDLLIAEWTAQTEILKEMIL